MDTVVQVDPEASLNVKNALCWLQCFIEGRSPFSLAIKKSQFPALKMSKSQFPFYPFRTLSLYILTAVAVLVILKSLISGVETRLKTMMRLSCAVF